METESSEPTTFEGGTSILHYLQEESKREEEAQRMSSPTHTARETGTRANSMDADNLARAEKGQRVENMLKKKKRSRRRKKGNFRAETAKILEEFLQSQLDERSVQTSPSKHYERYVELDVTETTTPSGESSGYGRSKTSLLREDSIPYIDEEEDDHGLRKSESLPHDDLANLHIEGKRGSIHHGKSKSDPHQNKIQQISEDEFKRQYPKYVRPTPPAPPGSPFSPSEEDSNGAKPVGHSRVPYTGTRTDSSLPSSYERMPRKAGSSGASSLFADDIPSAVVKGNNVVIQVGGGHDNKTSKEKTPPIPTTLPLPASSHDRPKSKTYRLKEHEANNRVESPKSNVTKRLVQTRKKSKRSSFKGALGGSGYLSSDECENSPTYSEDSHGRKKSKVKGFQRAKNRISSFFKRNKHTPSSDEDENDYKYSNRQDVISKTRKKHKVASKEEDVDECDMIPDENVPFDERVVNKKRVIRQKHTNYDTILREEHFSESIDTFRNGERHRTEIHGSVKESSGNGGGFFSRLSQRFSPKKRQREGTDSQSSQPSTDEVDSRVHSVHGSDAPDTISGHDHPDDASMAVHMSGGGFAVTRIDHQGPQNGSRSHCHVSQTVSKDDMKRHSSHIEIIDDTGKVIDVLEFDGGDQLPRNKSFVYNRVLSVTERRVEGPDGSHIVREFDTHGHMEINEEGDTSREIHDESIDSMNHHEKEEVYGRIASRLAAMGDNLMAEKCMDGTSPQSTSPGTRSDRSPEKAKSPETEFQPKPMEPWEKELSDELKRFADNLDEKLQADARTAAIKITGMVTYQTFKDSVQGSVGNENWSQIAAVFQITKRAVQAAGAGGAIAAQIKEITLKYIEDRFANFIVGQGGWDSMLSDDSGTDSELD